MIRKAFLYGFVFLSAAMLTACGPAVTENAEGEIVAVESTGGGSSLVSGLTFLLLLSILLFISLRLINKTGPSPSNEAADKNKPSSQPVPAQPKPIPETRATAKKNTAPKATSSEQVPRRSEPKPVAATPSAAKKSATANESAAPKPASSGHIFISYRRSDSDDIAGRIYDRLTGKFGRDPIFKDVDSIPLGLDFKEYLGAKVSECSVLLAIIGDRWLESRDEAGNLRLDDPTDFVRIEIESALERGIPVIPLLVRGAHVPAADRLPGTLKKLVYRNGTAIRSDPDFHRDMDRLIAALEKYV